MRQYTALLTRWQEGQARQDRRTQQVVWMLAEINRDRQSHPQPFALDDFALHRWPLVDRQRGEPAAEPVSEDALAWAEIADMQQRVARRFGEAAAVIQGNEAAEAMTHLNGRHRDG